MNCELCDNTRFPRSQSSRTDRSPPQPRRDKRRRPTKEYRCSTAASRNRVASDDATRQTADASPDRSFSRGPRTVYRPPPSGGDDPRLLGARFPDRLGQRLAGIFRAGCVGEELGRSRQREFAEDLRRAAALQGRLRHRPHRRDETALLADPRAARPDPPRHLASRDRMNGGDGASRRSHRPPRSLAPAASSITGGRQGRAPVPGPPRSRTDRPPTPLRIGRLPGWPGLRRP